MPRPKITDCDRMIGERIQELRLTKGLTQAQLAEGLNITHQQIHKYEVAIDRVSASCLALIAAVFEKPIGYFFEDNSEGGEGNA